MMCPACLFVLTPLHVRSVAVRHARRFRPNLDQLEARWLQTVTGLAAEASPTILVHPPQRNQPRGVANERVVPVTIEGQVATNGSSPPTIRFQVVDEYSLDQPQGVIPVQSIGRGSYLYTTRIGLVLSRRRNDLDGRQYTILVTASDANSAQGASIVVTVPHTRLQLGIIAHARPGRLVRPAMIM
ncbi:MAG TPA: hypothetical protein VGZ22_25020 [Isosphaeraceae bacterium]|jgi:hypothetical protein|nr:hypothetical protein [Isosphaeraceae bacterium]